MDDVIALVAAKNMMIIREYGNATIFPVSAILSLILGGFLFRTYRSFGSFNLFRKSEGASTACVLWWLLIAESLRAACSWIYLHSVNSNIILAPAVASAMLYGFALANVMMVVILVRSVFLFSPPEQVGRTLAACLLVTGAFLVYITATS